MNFNKQWSADQVIIGGGIIGLCSAYFLNEAGYDVVIIDKGPFWEAASYGNCGLISPSHAMPLNNPKLMAKALLWTLQSNAPFYIKPRMDFNLMSWMVKFAINASPSRVHRSMNSRFQLMQSSKELYQDLIGKHKLDCSWREDGILFVCKEEKTFNDLGKDIAFTNSEIGLNAKHYIGSNLIIKEPALRDDVYGGWLYEIDGHLKSDEFLKELTNLLLNKGVKFLNNQAVTSIQVKGSMVNEVWTEEECIKPNNVIVASGALSPILLKKIGIKVPVVPGKGYSITMETSENAPKLPCIFQERKTVATPWNEKGYRLGGTMEFSGYTAGINNKRIQALKDSAKEYLKNP